MLKIHAINRRVMIREGAEIDNETCNFFIAVDPNPEIGLIKGHSELTREEAKQFDQLCLLIERRLIADIGNPNKPGERVDPNDPAGWVRKFNAGVKLVDNEGREVSFIDYESGPGGGVVCGYRVLLGQDNSEFYYIPAGDLKEAPVQP